MGAARAERPDLWSAWKADGGFVSWVFRYETPEGTRETRRGV